MGSNAANSGHTGQRDPDATIAPEANLAARLRGALEAMQKRRHQQPEPEVIGNFWYIRPRQDVFVKGVRTRKRVRIKIAPASMHYREVLKIRDELLRPINQGLVSIGSAVNFRDYVQTEYIPGSLRLLARSTQETYKGAIRKHLLPVFGDFCLRDLTPRSLKQFFAGMASNDVPYPAIAKTRDVLASILRSAVEDELIVKNPLLGLKLPPDRRPRRRKPFLNPADFHLLLEVIPEPYSSMIYVCTLTGLRPGELLALRWRSILPNAIRVEESFYRGQFTCPKTKNSATIIAVDPRVIQRIERLKTLTVAVRAGLAVRRHALVKSTRPDDLVFQSVWQGKPMNAANVLKRFIRPAAQKLGLVGVDWRNLRRTCATWLVQSGADPKSTQGLMRHSRISTTMDIYAQIVSSAQQRAIEQLVDFVNQASPKLVPHLSQ